MEKGSEAKKNEYPQELKELGAAALLLASLKYKILDKKTASALHATKRRILKEKESKIDKLHAENTPTGVKKEKVMIEETLDALQIKPRNPQLQVFLPDYTPPAEPPVKCLSGLIGICSKPFVKQLTLSDVKDDQSRLSINKKHVTSSLLPMVNESELSQGIPVTTYDLDGNQYPMKFKQWSDKLYVLTSGWKRFCNDHALKQHQDFVTIWMFRLAETQNLCFAITWRRLAVYEQLGKRRGGKKQSKKGSK